VSWQGCWLGPLDRRLRGRGEILDLHRDALELLGRGGVGERRGRGAIADLHLDGLFGLKDPIENLLSLELPVGPGGGDAA
jgi:hypothetical protein